MASQVFYRKWRPQTLAEVVGQEPITQTLRNALSSSRISHAYLFCGPRGTGKTSTARILAKAVNCLSDGKGEPCNACAMCQAISEGRALDVIEIDELKETHWFKVTIQNCYGYRKTINFDSNMFFEVEGGDRIKIVYDKNGNVILLECYGRVK